jgi:hypothetical protein
MKKTRPRILFGRGAFRAWTAGLSCASLAAACSPPGARLRVDGEAEGGMQLVTVPDAPVLPFAFAHFAVRNSDLTSCSPL